MPAACRSMTPRVARLLTSSSGVNRNVFGNGVRRRACAIGGMLRREHRPPFMS